MGSVDPPKQRGASYADALRGHKVLAPRPKPAADKKVEVAPIPKDFPKATQNAAQKTPPQKGSKATQKKGPKKGAKAAREGNPAASQPKQSAKASKPKSSAPKTRKDAGQPAKPFSYAEAVKGKAWSMTRRPKVEASDETKPESPFSTQPPTPKSKPGQSPQQHDYRQASAGDKAVAAPPYDGIPGWDSRWDDVDRIIRQPAAPQQHRGVVGPTPSESAQNLHVPPSYAKPHKTHHGHWAQAPLQRIASHVATTGPVYNQRNRRFSVGDCPSSLSSSLSSSSPYIRSTQQPQQQPPAAPSSTTSAAPSRNTLFAVLNDHIIEFNIEQAIMSENKRLKMSGEREERIRSVIASHDRGDISLWESQYEWDVLIKCNDKNWRVHRDILCRESEYFAERLPPKDPNGGYVTLDCSTHCGMQLAHALYFMYDKTAQTTAMDLHTALNGEPLRRAAFAYIAGASVGCTSMTRAALTALHSAALHLKTFFAQTPRLTLERLDLAPLTAPLAKALAMGYEQGPRLGLYDLRVALAHVVDVVFLWLVGNVAFREVFKVEWVPWLWANVCNDAVFFSQGGVLDEMWEGLVRREGVRRKRLEREARGVTAGRGARRGGGGGSAGSGSSRKRSREDGEEMEIWRDGQPGEETTPTRWSASPTSYEQDDFKSLNGVRLTLDQLREVHKENLPGNPRTVPIPQRPYGGSEGGFLRPRENFNEVPGGGLPQLRPDTIDRPFPTMPPERRWTAANDGRDRNVEVNAGGGRILPALRPPPTNLNLPLRIIPPMRRQTTANDGREGNVDVNAGGPGILPRLRP